jgi:hypothetical protein
MLFTEWLKLKTENINPVVTLQMDAMGSLHMWKGDFKPVQTGKYTFAVEGKEADVYMQNKSDVDQVLNDLSPEQKQELVKGYPVVTSSVPDDYFMSNESKKWIQKVDMKKGAFKKHCGGEVTQDCIEKGLKSDDPHVVKMASLAKTFRKIAKDK